MPGPGPLPFCLDIVESSCCRGNCNIRVGTCAAAFSVAPGMSGGKSKGADDGGAHWQGEEHPRVQLMRGGRPDTGVPACCQSRAPR